MKKFFAIFLIFLAIISTVLTPVASALKTRTLDDFEVGRSMNQTALTFTMILMGKTTSVFTSPTKMFVVFAGIPIAAAILVPSMQGYYSRARDTNRRWALSYIALSLSAYNTDNDAYPKVPQNGCIPLELEKWYLNKIPTDPVKWRINYGCIDKTGKNSYAYRVLYAGTKDEIVILSADMEDANNNNSPFSIDEIVKNPGLLKKIESGKFKGKGKYFIHRASY